MNTSPNVLERLKLLRFIGIDVFFFNQIALYQQVPKYSELLIFCLLEDIDCNLEVNSATFVVGHGDLFYLHFVINLHIPV